MQQVELDTSIGYLLKRTSSLLRTSMEAVLRPLGMTVTHYSCLELLAQRPGLSSSALARGTFVTRQSMHLLLQSLEQQGFVERATTAAAGRTLPTTITEQGRQQLRVASAAVRGVEARMLSDLSEADEDLMRTMLAACAASLAAPQGS